MVFRIDVEEDASVELARTDVTVCEDAIVFSVEGRITDVPRELLAELAGAELAPTEVAFRRN